MKQSRSDHDTSQKNIIITKQVKSEILIIKQSNKIEFESINSTQKKHNSMHKNNEYNKIKHMQRHRLNIKTEIYKNGLKEEIFIPEIKEVQRNYPNLGSNEKR